MHTEVLFYFFHLLVHVTSKDQLKPLCYHSSLLYPEFSQDKTGINWLQLMFVFLNGSMHINLSGDKHPIELSVWDKII